MDSIPVHVELRNLGSFRRPALPKSMLERRWRYSQSNIDIGGKGEQDGEETGGVRHFFHLR